MNIPRFLACAIVAAMAAPLGSGLAQQVPIPQTPAEVPGPALGPVTGNAVTSPAPR